MKLVYREEREIFFIFFIFRFFCLSMIYPEKCVLSDKKENYCEFAQNIRGETHCALVLEWWHDTRVSQLDKCFLKIKNRAKLSWRNRQIKKQKLP